MFDCRSQEEISGLKRKLDRYKSREWMASSDEVLLEEIKTYKVMPLSFPLSLFTLCAHRPSSTVHAVVLVRKTQYSPNASMCSAPSASEVDTTQDSESVRSVVLLLVLMTFIKFIFLETVSHIILCAVTSICQHKQIVYIYLYFALL